MASRGIVIFGVNNARVDYIRLAVICASFIKRNLPRTDVCLITDEHSKLYYDGLEPGRLNQLFSHVVLLPEAEPRFKSNERTYRDTRYYTFKDQFKNESRSTVYELSPFDETILIDSDYLVLSDNLKHCWGSVNDVMINRDGLSLLNQPLGGDEYRLNPHGVRMYWATVIYFRKGDTARQLFNLVEHVKENWAYYAALYELPRDLFRNDYAFSIAIHLLNGFIDAPSVAPLPEPTILTSYDFDQFYRLNAPNDLSFFANDPKENWKFYVSRVKGVNVHCMNKLSLLNNSATILEALR